MKIKIALLIIWNTIVFTNLLAQTSSHITSLGDITINFPEKPILETNENDIRYKTNTADSSASFEIVKRKMINNTNKNSSKNESNNEQEIYQISKKNIINSLPKKAVIFNEKVITKSENKVFELIIISENEKDELQLITYWIIIKKENTYEISYRMNNKFANENLRYNFFNSLKIKK